MPSGILVIVFSLSTNCAFSFCFSLPSLPVQELHFCPQMTLGMLSPGPGLDCSQFLSPGGALGDGRLRQELRWASLPGKLWVCCFHKAVAAGVRLVDVLAVFTRGGGKHHVSSDIKQGAWLRPLFLMGFCQALYSAKAILASVTTCFRTRALARLFLCFWAISDAFLSCI
jgi:hypothetical protein